MDSSPSNAPRAVVYARVSTDEQREGQTIDSQIEELRRFAEQKGWAVSETYKDEGWSGSILGRPELDRLRDDASRHLFDVVLINDVDRLARDVTHLGVIKRDLLRHSVAIIFRKLPNDNTPTNNLLVNILGSFAEFERELIADRTRRGRRYKVETRQRFLGCVAPYGYRYVPRQHSASGEGDLQRLRSEAAVVEEMFRWVDVEGLSARQVVTRLNDKTVPPRRGGRTWQRSSVLRILRSEVYTGIWHYNKHELRHHAEGITDLSRRHRRTSLCRRPRSAWIPVTLPETLRIIDRGQWKRVQRQLDANISFSPRHSKHNYLLRSLVRCGACSAPYVGDPNHGRYYYRCTSRCRKSPAVREESLNQVVWNAVVAVIANPALITSRLAELLERRRAQASRSQTKALEASAPLGRLVAEEDRMITAYRTGIISAQALARELERIGERRSALQEPTSAPTAVGDAGHCDIQIESVVDFLDYAAARLSRFTEHERQRFLRLVVRSIRIEGGAIRIIGRIPSIDEVPRAAPLPEHPANPPEARTMSDAALAVRNGALAPEALSCRIAPTEAALGGRNAVVEFELTASLDLTKPQQPRDEKTGRFVA